MTSQGLLERLDTARPERLSDEGLARLLHDLGPETAAMVRRAARQAAWRAALEEALLEERHAAAV